jgi:branched-chain amino acid transport system substrate-binding protein
VIGRLRELLGILVAAAIMCCISSARAAEPITIGFGMALTGGLAVPARSALLAMKIWEERVNAQGGLLGRPVKLVYYDDESNPSLAPGIYAKLLEVDKVDLVISGYASNMIAAAMPVVMQHNMVYFGLFGLAVNSEFHYAKYFSTLATGSDAKQVFSQGYFDLAAAQDPTPATVAILGADLEYAKNATEGARANAKRAGLRIVYDRSYPPATTDFSTIIRAIDATAPDVVYVASFPPDSVGIIRAANEIGLKTKMLGGGMVGVPTAQLKMQLGPLLNGIVNVEWWLPAPTMQFPGVADFLATYQARALAEGVDPLGYFLPPYAYAELQILGDAVTATASLDQDKLADYIHRTTFHTVVGDVTFGADGEWAEARPLWVQFRNISGNDLEQFKGKAMEVILLPPAYKSGDIVYPFAAARR